MRQLHFRSERAKCSAEKCKQCIDGFEGDIIGFPCDEKCRRCAFCTGFFEYLPVCIEHCQNGVKGCTKKCQDGKKICLSCHCSDQI